MPYRPAWKQAGVPPAVTTVRRELTTPGAGMGRGAGPATAGRTGPPITWRTVRTLTPCPACRASQPSTLSSSGRVTPSAQAWAQTSWMVKMIQPPPCCWAPVTIFSKVAGDHLVPTDATSMGARSRYGLRGGMVSAQAQCGHSPAPRNCPVPSAEL